MLFNSNLSCDNFRLIQYNRYRCYSTEEHRYGGKMCGENTTVLEPNPHTHGVMMGKTEYCDGKRSQNC